MEHVEEDEQHSSYMETVDSNLHIKFEGVNNELDENHCESSRMPFKIVQAIEDNQLCLTIIPSQWERGGILYWPKSRNITSFLKDELFETGKEKWEKSMCVMKRECRSLNEAERELKIMEGKADTDVRQVHSIQYQPKRKKRIINDISNTANLSFNEPMVILSKTQIPYLQAPVFSDSNPIGIAENALEENSDLELRNVELTNKVIEPIGTLNVETVIKNQQLIISQQSKLQTSIDALTALIAEKLNVGGIESASASKTIQIHTNEFQPINSLEMLNSLEENLKSPQYMNKMITNLSLTCGRSGHVNGLDYCYKLIDLVLDRSFITRCSWTGGARNGKKIGLKFFENFRKCFLEIVRLADADFSADECDTFFKRIIKNSSQRHVAKRISSKHKSRPSGLTYRWQSKELRDERVTEYDRMQGVDGNNIVNDECKVIENVKEEDVEFDESNVADDGITDEDDSDE